MTRNIGRRHLSFAFSYPRPNGSQARCHMIRFGAKGLGILLLAAALLCSSRLNAQNQPVKASGATIRAAILGEENPRTPEVSTEELERLLASASVVLLDTRPHLEWALGHIPGALNVAPKPGMTMSQYTSDVSEIGRLVSGDKTRALVLYCNGPHCGKSKRVSDELLAAGYSNVRRYQLGAPVWRALGGVMVMELDGVRHVLKNDRTAVFIDARDVSEFAAGTLNGARNIPRSKVLPGKDVGEVKAAKDDGRLPMEDHNTRIVVFGRDAQQARAVAEALAREAFHNVSYIEGDLRVILGLER
jgi:rhodanese-related sulfurtransferase